MGVADAKLEEVAMRAMQGGVGKDSDCAGREEEEIDDVDCFEYR